VRGDVLAAGPAEAAEAAAAFAAAGLQVVAGFELPGDPWRRPGVVCVGQVGDRPSLGDAVLAAGRAEAVVVWSSEPRWLQALAADLRRLDALGGGSGPSPEAAQLAALPAEQRDVLALVAAGLSLPEVAGRLYLSVRTAERRLAHVRRALGVDSTAAAIAVHARAVAGSGDDSTRGGGHAGGLER
jgi:DNA-binding CsgD family transcriptional regulator